ncbi:MAG: hypothetical protein IH600_18390 [Bacteroidetes bacterium]|nr:hypothetical protein [Bacteroidota bacterium]
MYLRLPWIVGQAGLWTTIGIILVAHIISITTGLSVASIATDKRVKAGGLFYIISRSLGLPIGGTLGLALFVGLSFSVSLYIIGFIESFLPVLGIASTIYNIRLYGTLALVAVSSVVLISTSLAIRTQYLILGAIVLSLIAIFFGKTHLAPPAPLLTPWPQGESLMVLFGIFFPAVTGFTAGVQMSGDLKDPKKSIPIGTMAAIGVGFIVYVGIAVFISFRVNAQELVSNPNVLMEIALVPSFLVAGIWGATLSSAMGSLLGAPRILQAMSLDRITPQVFRTGHGPSNEPRSALLLTFIIAEAGILIGELNVIAGIVSIFFITTYGFINLSCAVENWASPDFRPSFRIPTWVSVVGATASFIVMIELDLISFVGSTLILGALYIYLQRQELTLESGDTWEGVWSSVIRSGLHRLDRSVRHARNWRPNIILFSGGVSKRPHLIELGKWIVDRRGIMSNFDLIEQPDAGVLFQKSEQVLHDNTETAEGIFSRQLECRDIYDGMEVISQVFGFSGVEPNTVLMGWARNTRDPLRFTKLVRHLSELDYNILLLDYDAERGFGEQARIDIWWRGGNNNTTLELTILKFLTMSAEWQHAEARILTLVDDREMVHRVHKNIRQVLDEQRIVATVKVINNSIEKLPFTDVVQAESSEADLIMIGLPVFDEHTLPDFVSKINTILANLGSTLLVQASSMFDPLYSGLQEDVPTSTSEVETVIEEQLPDLVLSATSEENVHERLAHELTRITGETEGVLGDYAVSSMERISGINQGFISELHDLVDRGFSVLHRRLPGDSDPAYQTLFSRVQADILDSFQRQFATFEQEQVPAQKTEFELGLEQLLSQLDTLEASIPETITVFHDVSVLKPERRDDARILWFKWRKRINWHLRKTLPTIRLQLRRRLSYDMQVRLRHLVFVHAEAFGIHSYQLISELQKWLNEVRDRLAVLGNELESGTITESLIREEQGRLESRLNDITRMQRDRVQGNSVRLLAGNRKMMKDLYDDALYLDINRIIRKECKTPKSALELKSTILGMPVSWQHNITLMLHYASMEIHLMVFLSRAHESTKKLMAQVRDDINRLVLSPLDELDAKLQSLDDSLDGDLANSFQHVLRQQDGMDPQAIIRSTDTLIQEALEELPEIVVIIDEDSFRNIDTIQYQGMGTTSINLRRLVNYIIEQELVDPLRSKLLELHKQSTIARNATIEVLRLVQFSRESADPSEVLGDEDLRHSFSDTVRSGIRRLSKERLRAEQIMNDLRNAVQVYMRGAATKLNPYLISRAADSVSHGIRSNTSNRLIEAIMKESRNIMTFVNNSIVNLLYRRSEGVLLARRLRGASVLETASADALLTFTDRVSPRAEVLRGLPFYYRQIFTGKQPIGSDLLVGQNVEMEKADSVIRLFRQGYRGGLLVLGEPDAGKTTLCRSIVRGHFDELNTFHLFPPEVGCIDRDRFRMLLADALRSQGDFDQLFLTIPSGSVVVLHDLELWWERSQGGLAVIDEIVRLIDKYSDRCMFIVNASTHSFRFINRLRAIDKTFMGIIMCEPFDAKELQEAILLRHRTTGLTFTLNGHAEEHFSGYQQAKLFTRYFDYSAGNIGNALNAWISNIQSVESESLVIRAPRRSSTAILGQLENEWQIWLLQFVLHKMLTTERLARLFHRDITHVEARTNELKRAGLIVKTPSGAQRINPFVRPFIIQQLVEAKML